MSSKWSDVPPRLDTWTICDRAHTHWGAAGAAGLLLCYFASGVPPVYLLERRCSTVDHNGRWCLPGGAIRRGESPEMAANREAEEEIGMLPSYEVTAVDTQACGGGWNFYILTARVAEPFTPLCISETDAAGWFSQEQMRDLLLHPGFERWLDQNNLSDERRISGDG